MSRPRTEQQRKFDPAGILTRVTWYKNEPATLSNNSHCSIMQYIIEGIQIIILLPLNMPYFYQDLSTGKNISSGKNISLVNISS